MAGESVTIDPTAVTPSAQTSQMPTAANIANPAPGVVEAIGQGALNAGQAVSNVGAAAGQFIDATAPQQAPPPVAAPQQVTQPTAAPVEADPALQPDPVVVAAKAVERKQQIEDQVSEEVAQTSAIQQIERDVQDETQRAVAKVDEEIAAIGPQQLSDYFNQGSIWQKLLAGISLGVGGYYSGAYGRENPALAILTKEAEGNRELRKLKQDERSKIMAAQADLLAKKLKAYEDDPSRNPMARLKMQEVRLGLDKLRADTTKSLADAELSRIKARVEGAGTSGNAKLQKLPQETKVKIAFAREGLDAVNQIAKALESGVNTFSLVGDNEYTLAREYFTQALGRMNSGGVITKDEEAAFQRALPKVTDTKDIQRKKLLATQAQMANRLRVYGVEPEDVGLTEEPINYGLETSRRDKSQQSQITPEIEEQLRKKGLKQKEIDRLKEKY